MGVASCKPADALVFVLLAFVVIDLVYSSVVPRDWLGT